MSTPIRLLTSNIADGFVVGTKFQKPSHIWILMKPNIQVFEARTMLLHKHNLEIVIDPESPNESFVVKCTDCGIRYAGSFK